MCSEDLTFRFFSLYLHIPLPTFSITSRIATHSLRICILVKDLVLNRISPRLATAGSYYGGNSRDKLVSQLTFPHTLWSHSVLRLLLNSSAEVILMAQFPQC